MSSNSAEGAKKYEVLPAEALNSRGLPTTASKPSDKKPSAAYGDASAAGSAASAAAPTEKPKLVQTDSVMGGSAMLIARSSASVDDREKSSSTRVGTHSFNSSGTSIRKRFTIVRKRSDHTLASKVLQKSLLPEDVQLAKSIRGRRHHKKLFRKLLNTDAVGSRSVGGEAPRDVDEYALAQSNDYMLPDTVAHAQVVRSTTPRQRQMR